MMSRRFLVPNASSRRQKVKSRMISYHAEHGDLLLHGYVRRRVYTQEIRRNGGECND